MAKITGIIKKDSLDFLKALSKNNNREWFNQYKSRYTEAQGNIVAFADALLDELNKHDEIETPSGKDSVFRIYKDVRFSKDKTPYNQHWSGFYKRATNRRRGGYYYRLEPGKSFLAAGFWGPNPADMRRIRQDIDYNYAEWEKLLANKTITGTFGSMLGEKLSSAPRGYAKDHPAIHLLQYKQFIFKHPFTDEEICSPGFAKQASGVYKKIRPFLDFMSEVLTTDANGQPII